MKILCKLWPVVGGLIDLWMLGYALYLGYDGDYSKGCYFLLFLLLGEVVTLRRAA